MSKLFNPSKLSEKRTILQNVNAFVAIHDLTCQCEQPLKCIIQQIYLQEPTLQFQPTELQKWLTTTGTSGDHGGKDASDFTGEELDALFANTEEDTEG